jgi:hypothetical protein
MSVRNYIQNAKANYANWTGNQNGTPANFSGGRNRYQNYAEGTPTGIEGMQGPRMTLSATGGQGQTPQSQPYIITISNASATAVANFDVLGAYTYINSTGFSNGSLTLSGVTISSAISNVNYQQFLYQSMNQPFSVGLTYIESVSGSSSQITQTFTLNTQDANGNQMLRTVVPTIDPYQQQSTIVAVKQLYAIDGFTKITFTTVAASVVFRLHFYPAINVNLASGLSGNPVTQAFSSPNLFGVPTNIVNG